jgi:Ca2+-binding EF-hand superfamily protein
MSGFARGSSCKPTGSTRDSNYSLNLVYQQYSSGNFSRDEFYSQLEGLGYQITPTLYRVTNQPDLSFKDFVQALRKTTTIKPCTNSQIRTQSAVSPQQLVKKLYHPENEAQYDYHGGQDTYGGEFSMNTLLQEDHTRRGSYFSAVQMKAEGGAEKVVMQKLRKMLVARCTLDQAVDFFAKAPTVHGVHIEVVVKKLKTLGVFLENGEIKVIELKYPSKSSIQHHVDGQKIGEILSNTVVDAPSRGYAHTYVPPEKNIYHNHQAHDTLPHYASSSTSQSSILSSLTNGTSNHVPGHISVKKSFSKVQDEYIFIRILKILCVDGTVKNLRRLRSNLIEAGRRNDPEQRQPSYSFEVIGKINFYFFNMILKDFVPSMPESDLIAIFDNLFPDMKKEVDSNTFYHRLRGIMARDRVEAIEDVFQGLLLACPERDPSKDSGEVSLQTLFNNYCPDREPDVINGHSNTQTKTSELLQLHQFSTNHGTITRKAFFDYFGDLSACKPDTDDFLNIMTLPWYKVLHVSKAKYPAKGRPSGFHSAIRAHHVKKEIPTKVCRVLQRVIRDASWSDASLRALYDKFDIDGDGSITQTEFCRFFAELQIRITADEMDQLMEVLDTDGDGSISFEEFMAVVHTSQHLERTTGYMNVPSRPVTDNGSNLLSSKRANLTEDSLLPIRSQLENLKKQMKYDKKFGFRGYADLLIGYEQMTSSRSPWITRAQFESILHSANVRLSRHVAYEVFEVFQVQHAYQDLVHFWQFLDSISAEWNDRRRRITQRAFKKIDINGDGQLTVQEVANGFNAKKHPSVINNGADHTVLRETFYNFLNSAGSPNRPITAKQWNRLLRYTISACEESDDSYEEIMNAIWYVE